MRTPVIAANWKLHKTIKEAQLFIQKLKPLVHDISGVEIVVCPVFTALSATRAAAENSSISIGAQDMFWKEEGAFTGEVSVPLLKDAGCTYVIIGHSERRRRFGAPDEDLTGNAGSVFGDNDASVNKKIIAALQESIIPIVCVGEVLAEREAGQTDAVVESQVRAALQNVENPSEIIFAYEPVWAIGTGKTCDAAEAGRVCGHIRHVVKQLAGEAVADAVRIQYGGSVKPANAAELLAHSEIDGALVGGAGLEAETFFPIIEAAV